MDRKYHRSATHQALRNILATMISELKRDRKYLIENPGYSGLDIGIAFDLGYMNAITYAIKVEVQNSMSFGYVHDLMKKDSEQASRVLRRVS